MESKQLPTSPAESPQPERQWVWRASPASRAAGKISVLACVETVLAVALYWWIAIRWDTHWHLVSSVFIAPLLLLRSPESIAAGVRWFSKDWFCSTNFDAQPMKRRVFSNATTAVFSMAIGSCVFQLQWRVTPANPTDWWNWFGWLAAIWASSTILCQAVVQAANPFYTRVVALGTYATGWSISGVWVMAVILTLKTHGANLHSIVAATGVIAVQFAAVALCSVSIAMGIVLRALFVRVASTLFYAVVGLPRIPINLLENCTAADTLLPLNVIPGIRSTIPILTSDGFASALRNYPMNRGMYLRYLLMLPFYFLPALLYRLNIKATAWFWWPLAFLLRPLKQPTVEEDQKEALCWPWTNPFQKLVFVGVSLLALVVLFVRHVDQARWSRLSQAEGVWTPVKALLAVNWSHIPPWHWAILISAVCSVLMLALAGGAVSCSVNKKWPPPGLGWKVKAMESLVRVRSLATVALLLFSLGALFITHTPWHRHVPLPESWYGAMKEFYRVTPPQEFGRAHSFPEY